ncbi:MAG: nucleoside recognition protein [Lachnospiraceae bacterium]|nr:nucleoside recognition protein [Lachnospiraceae bacterium]
MKTIGIRLLSILFFALVLLFPADTLAGSASGLLLWFQTVLPTLLPAMILADYLIRIRADRYISRLAARPLRFIFGVSDDGAYAVLTGFLCGYPMGAKTTASLLSRGRIAKEEADYLLSFCNQPSPMFLIGFLCAGLLSDPKRPAAWTAAVLTGVYLSAFLTSFFFRTLRFLKRQRPAGERPDQAKALPTDKKSGPAEITQKTTDFSPLALLETSMMTSFEVMVKIGGYMMLFSILEAWIQKLSFPGPSPQSVLMGFVEMTTGSRQIAACWPLSRAAAFCCGVTAFGGLSGFAQTANVLKGSGLSAGRYFLWKLLQGGLAFALVLLWPLFVSALTLP